MTVPLHRNRRFATLWTGQTVSSLGSATAAVAYPLLALAATGSPTTAGLVGFASGVAVVAGSLPAGVWADRYPPRALLLAANVVRAAAAAGIAAAVLTGHASLAVLIVAAVISAFVGPTAFAAGTVAVRHVVTAEQLPAALAQDEARGHLGDLVGRPLGGYLFGIAAAVPVLADAASFLVAAGTAAAVRITRGTAADRTPMHRAVGDGLRLIRRTPFLYATMCWAAIVNIAFAGLTFAVVAARATGSTGLGLALGIGSLGGLAGAFVGPRVLRRLSGRTVLIGFGGTVTACLIGLGLTGSVPVVGACLSIIYAVTAPTNAVMFAAQIHVTPEGMQGRVISAAVTMMSVTAPLGPLLAGVLIGWSGRAAAFGTFAALVGAATSGLLASRSLRDMPTRMPDPQEPATEMQPV